MADTGLTVWAAGFWPDDFWAAGFWSDGDAPPVVVTPETAGSGGIWYEFERVQAAIRRKRKDREDRERERASIEDTQSREIAQLLAKQEAKDEAREELARLQAIADRYARPGIEVPRPILASVMKAHEERTRNALEQMQREINRMMEEEEAAVIAMLMLDD